MIQIDRIGLTFTRRRKTSGPGQCSRERGSSGLGNPFLGTSVHVYYLSPRHAMSFSFDMLHPTTSHFHNSSKPTELYVEVPPFQDGLYYPLEFPNRSTFAFKNSINVLLLVKADIFPKARKALNSIGIVTSFVSSIQLAILWYLLFLSVLVSRI